jgi:aromatic-L-amino-acid decarboxylase
MDAILADIDRLIPALLIESSSFFAYFATSTSGPGIFGELLSAAFDNKSMLWRTSPASTNWKSCARLVAPNDGPRQGMSGIIYDTVSVSVCMHCGRTEGVESEFVKRGCGRPDLPLLRVYVSEQAHSSIEKAVITLGFVSEGCPSD